MFTAVTSSDALLPVMNSEKMKFVCDMVRQVANTDATVLITGETGTGKELVAKAIHNLSGRHSSPLAIIELSNIKHDHFETELFGFRKGAFTGSIETKPGLIECAKNGTVFLDEISELSLENQGKLLRMLESGEVRRLGELHVQHLASRFVIATNRNLFDMVYGNPRTFREDLYHRLNVFNIYIPPLRERPEDILPLAEYFLAWFSKKFDICGIGFSREYIQALLDYDWPGNVRELRNVIEGSVILCRNDKTINKILLPKRQKCEPREDPAPTEEIAGPVNLEEAVDKTKKTLIIKVLEETKWNRSKARVLLGVSYKNLLLLMKKYDL